MGAADIIPGVSGGTIAFITGIYEELIDTLKSINPKLLPVLFKQGPKAFWQAMNGNFLFSLLVGIIGSFITLAHAISYLMTSWPLLLWSFFFGLVLASALHVIRQVKIRCPLSLSMLALGTIAAFVVTIMRPAAIDPGYLAIFAAGAVAICAMILPGISGSFILLLMGLYGFIIAAIKSLDMAVISVFVLGCATGLLSFVHVLSWLLHHYRSQTLALLTGFLIGSLNALWPWKVVTEYYRAPGREPRPLTQSNVLPGQFESATGDSAMLLTCIFMVVAGVGIVWLLERANGKHE